MTGAKIRAIRMLNREKCLTNALFSIFVQSCDVQNSYCFAQSIVEHLYRQFAIGCTKNLIPKPGDDLPKDHHKCCQVKSGGETRDLIHFFHRGGGQKNDCNDHIFVSKRRFKESSYLQISRYSIFCISHQRILF